MGRLQGTQYRQLRNQENGGNMNGMKLRKRKRHRIVYESIKILIRDGETEINVLVRKLEELKLSYRLTPNKLAQYLRNHPDIHRVQGFQSTNRIAVYSWKPSKEVPQSD